MSQSSESCCHNPLCCFSTNNTKDKRIFRYRLSPETFGYTLVYSLIFKGSSHVLRERDPKFITWRNWVLPEIRITSTFHKTQNKLLSKKKVSLVRYSVKLPESLKFKTFNIKVCDWRSRWYIGCLPRFVSRSVIGNKPPVATMPCVYSARSFMNRYFFMRT
jgi:hypothetical protein